MHALLPVKMVAASPPAVDLFVMWWFEPDVLQTRLTEAAVLWSVSDLVAVQTGYKRSQPDP